MTWTIDLNQQASDLIEHLDRRHQITVTAVMEPDPLSKLHRVLHKNPLLLLLTRLMEEEDTWLNG